MGFAVPAEAYDRFMGRYALPLAPVFADFAGVVAGQRVVDVGSGPGALTGELVARVGAEHVVALDPAEGFVQAVRERYPGVEVHRAGAEALPLADGTADAALAQLVVHFMHDPVAGLGEMARVTRPGGTVAACVWDFHEGGSPLSTFWSVAQALDPTAPGETELPGTRRGHLAELLSAAGVADVEDTLLTVEVAHPTFEAWWDPYELGVGPAGAYVAALAAAQRKALRDRCRAVLPDAPFTLTAAAWAARGVAMGAPAPKRQPTSAPSAPV